MLKDDEKVARLLFSDQMVDPETGKLKCIAFPVSELIEDVDKRTGKPCSVSVDRCHLLKDERKTLEQKADVFQKPEKQRAKWGYAYASAQDIRAILFNSENGRQGPPFNVFNVFEDPITDGENPDWDHAHAKVVRAHPSYKKALIRGYRDKLTDLFQRNMVRFR